MAPLEAGASSTTMALIHVPRQMYQVGETELWIDVGSTFGMARTDRVLWGLPRLDSSMVRGRRVLELGSGTGALGLSAKVLGAAEVVLTDRHPETSRANAENNRIRVDCRPLDWTEPLPTWAVNFDVLLASECVYGDVSAFDETLRRLFDKNPTATAFIFNQSNKPFLKWLRRLKDFDVRPIDGGFRVSSRPRSSSS